MNVFRQSFRKEAAQGTRLRASAKFAFGLVLSALAATGTLAQAGYPSRTVKILVGFPAGTAPDTLARLIADRLQIGLGQPVVIENMPGASGNLAASHVARAEPDGHTLLLAGNASIVVNQFLFKSLPYDPAKHLALISQVASMPNILVVHPDVPATTTDELANAARVDPDGLIFAHTGAGTSTHIAGELLKHAEKISVRQVAYRGGNTIYPDLITGRVNVCFCNATTALPLIKERKLRALAVTSLSRWPAAPDISTMVEAGYRNFDASAWFGLVAPAGTPPHILTRLHKETVAALLHSETSTTLNTLGMIKIGNSPDEFASVAGTEMTYWENTIKVLGLSLP